MIDSHCHLADEAFEGDLEGVVDRARRAGLDRTLCVLDPTEDAEAVRGDRVLAVWPSTRFAVGVHPHHAGRFGDRIDEVGALVGSALGKREGACAVGEIGLDYHYDFAPREVQREVFRCQVRLAREMSYPIVVHTREAEDDTFKILTEEGASAAGGVFHCFTGDAAMAARAVELGFCVSFSGIVTFRGAESVRQAAATVPVDRLLVETDAPYLAPVPHRGKRNEPAWVAHVIETLSQIRGVPIEALCTETTSCFDSLFKSREMVSGAIDEPS